MKLWLSGTLALSHLFFTWGIVTGRKVLARSPGTVNRCHTHRPFASLQTIAAGATHIGKTALHSAGAVTFNHSLPKQVSQVA